MATTTDLEKLTEGYRIYCQAEGKSPRTIRWYLGKLRIFRDYLQEQALPTDAAELTTTHLRAFLVHLRENVKADELNPQKPTRDAPLAGGTIQGYARTLKAFFAWLAREGYLPEDPAKRVKVPKAPKVIIETFTDAQVAKLLGMVDQHTERGYCGYCILLRMLDTGIRLSELVHLGTRDVDLERGMFKVLGKGARERMVPFGAQVQAPRAAC